MQQRLQEGDLLSHSEAKSVPWRDSDSAFARAGGLNQLLELVGLTRPELLRQLERCCADEKLVLRGAVRCGAIVLTCLRPLANVTRWRINYNQSGRESEFMKKKS